LLCFPLVAYKTTGRLSQRARHGAPTWRVGRVETAAPTNSVGQPPRPFLAQCQHCSLVTHAPTRKTGAPARARRLRRRWTCASSPLSFIGCRRRGRSKATYVLRRGGAMALATAPPTEGDRCGHSGPLRSSGTWTPTISGGALHPSCAPLASLIQRCSWGVLSDGASKTQSHKGGSPPQRSRPRHSAWLRPQHLGVPVLVGCVGGRWSRYGLAQLESPSPAARNGGTHALDGHRASVMYWVGRGHGRDDYR